MSDSDKLLEHLIKTHGVALAKDDPIMILNTAHQMILADTRAAQDASLTAFREEIEAVSFRWNEESKLRAERILNASLQAATNAMHETISKATRDAMNTWQLAADSTLQRFEKSAQIFKRFMVFGTISMGVIGFSVVILMPKGLT